MIKCSNVQPVEAAAPGLPPTKTDQVRDLVAEGNYKKALSITKGFRRGLPKEDIESMRIAYEAMVRPEFYRQIGKDPEALVQQGIDTLIKLYGGPEEVITL